MKEKISLSEVKELYEKEIIMNIDEQDTDNLQNSVTVARLNGKINLNQKKNSNTNRKNKSKDKKKIKKNQ